MMAPDGILIRRITTDADLDAVVDLEARCFTNPWTREMLVRELAQSDVAHVFVLRLADQTVAAFCSCWIVADELHINTVAVDHAHRRHGLGTELLRHVMADAAARGAVRATLEVRASNEPARLLYERLGFTVSAMRPGYYTQPEEDALILWRERLFE
jgi:ribosomal-protein-alanine N-acetyltransferase